MNKFRFEETEIEGLYVVEQKIFHDERGYFMETYNEEFVPYVKHQDGTPAVFVQDNESLSVKGVVRGLHAQIRFPQGKLVRVIQGRIFDVAVDIRKGSKTFGKWYGVILSSENKKQLLIPEGFLHGFLALSDTAITSYKCTNLYHPEDECRIRWDDPDIGVQWPTEGLQVLIGEKDRSNISFQTFLEKVCGK